MKVFEVIPLYREYALLMEMKKGIDLAAKKGNYKGCRVIAGGVRFELSPGNAKKLLSIQTTQIDKRIEEIRAFLKPHKLELELSDNWQEDVY